MASPNTSPSNGRIRGLLTRYRRDSRCQLGHAMQIELGSQAAVSRKREYFKCLPETIGYFALRMPKFGTRRLVTNSQKPAIGGPFCEYQKHFL